MLRMSMALTAVWQHLSPLGSNLAVSNRHRGVQKSRRFKQRARISVVLISLLAAAPLQMGKAHTDCESHAASQTGSSLTAFVLA